MMKTTSIKNNKIIKESKKRCNYFRKKILYMSQNVSALHIGGAFSSVEIIDTIYGILKNKNDKFILSKGHAGILLYVVLNYLKIISDYQLKNYCKKKGKLGVHPDYKLPGVEASTGSLGHGLAIASGLAYANKKNILYVLMSDGEMHEGSIWEAALLISSKKINNIIVVIDCNGLQSSTWDKDTHPSLNPIHKKFKAFGWDSETCNGHDVNDILKKLKKKKNKPFALIAKTTKGYPISFMKNNPIWHYRSPNKIELKKSIKELEKYEK